MMDARERVLNFVLANEPDHGNIMFVDPETGGALTDSEAANHVAGLLDEVRAEVLREARKEIIAAQAVTPDLKAREAWKSGYKAGLSMAAVITTP